MYGLGGEIGPKIDTFYPQTEPGVGGPAGTDTPIIDTIHEV